jgi:hypothetical protein
MSGKEQTLTRSEIKAVLDAAHKRAAKTRDADSIQMLRVHITEIDRQLTELLDGKTKSAA